jgi:hypothetical protein
MAKDDRGNPPLLNPVLELRKDPLPQRAQGGGVGKKDIVHERLQAQRDALASAVEAIAADSRPVVAHGGRLHLVARMFADSYAPSKTPTGLVDDRFDCRLVAPVRGGYLIEAATAKLRFWANYLRTAVSIEAMVAISRVAEIRPFDISELLNGRSLEAVWDTAAEVNGGKAFILWLAPFRNVDARQSVIQTLETLEKRQVMLPTWPGVALPPPGMAPVAAVPVTRRDQTGLARAVRRYRNEGVARSLVTIPGKDALVELAASGSSFRIDPVRRVEVTAPGVGAEPVPPVPNAAAQPVVAVIDGGLSARSYIGMEAWRAPSLVPDGMNDHAHGNRISSLVVHAHAWNNELDLPELTCRVGTVQAIPRQGANFTASPQQLIDYLHLVARNHPEARVWNMSFNAIAPEDDPGLVSYLGHEIALLARANDILPVVSIGNRRPGNPDRLCAPADCEAALTVGGRQFDKHGRPAAECPVSLKGPGPDGMLKPDLSWFSHLRMLGGTPHTGSSYAVPPVATLAAHTFNNLKAPSADLVRALLINNSELETHDSALGWGTPWDGHLPWTCAPGSVTLAWRAKLRPGFAYYWNEIPIPPEMVRGGKLIGKGKLTAILNPVLSELGGANYFATRLQVALQYTTRAGKTGNLLGSMKEDTTAEMEARTELAKWQPVRRHMRDFAKGSGM